MRSIIVLPALLMAAGAWAVETYIDWDKTAGFENYRTFV